MKQLLTIETNKYSLKIENFEGPLDLLCHLIEKNKMNIYDIKISDITNQYIVFLDELKNENLEITSEFLVMASTLLYLKSKSLLPKLDEEDEEITEEELIRKIIEYKKYKEITKTFRELYNLYTKRIYKFSEKIEIKKKEIDEEHDKGIIHNNYKKLINRNEDKINHYAKNIEQLAIPEQISVRTKVKDIFRELSKKTSFIFSSLFSIKKQSKAEVITAFSGLLELNRRNKVVADQEELFGDIVVKRKNK